MTSRTTNKFLPEVRERAVRLVLDHEGDHSSRWTACQSIATKVGCSAHTLLDWVKRAEIDAGKRAGLPTDMAEKMKAPPGNVACFYAAPLAWFCSAVDRRTYHRLANRLGIGRVVFVRLHEGADILGRDQPYLVAEIAKPPRPIMRARTGLYADEAGSKVVEKAFYVIPSEPAANHRLAAAVCSVNLEYGLGDIEPDDVNFLRHGRSPLRTTPNNDPFQRRGGRGRLCHHARRKFFDLTVSGPAPVATEALRGIGELYEIERSVRGRRADERLQARQARAVPKVAALRDWLERELARQSAKSLTAGAIRYALSRWAALCRYLDDGRIEIDNNAAERAIRPVTLGRKNWLFAGSDDGGERAADILTLIETARLNGVDPEPWLRDVLARIHDHPARRIDELLPWNAKPDVPTFPAPAQA